MTGVQTCALPICFPVTICALGVEVVGCQEVDAELSAVWVFVAFNSCAGFVAHAIPKGWWSLHFSFGLGGFDVLGGICRRVRS